MSGDTHKVESLRVLVIEDNTFTRELIHRFLMSMGVKEIWLAADGDEALKILSNKQTPIDVAFCDIHMPGMDGIELIRRTSNLSHHPALVIISASHETFLSTVADLARSRGLTVLDWIVKPVSPKRISSILTEYATTLSVIEAERAAGMSFTAQAPALSSALSGREFILHYQPKISARTGAVEGFEALIRWQHPKYGLLWPKAFIGDAVKCGLIGQITDWAVQSAFAQCAAWKSEGPFTKLSLNLDFSLLRDATLAARWATEAAREGVKPSQIIFEIPEAAIAGEDSGSYLGVLRDFRERGFSLSIDNVGMSHTFLEQMSEMPFNEMKIDSALTMNCHVDGSAHEIVKASIALARRFDMGVVANGVENETEAKTLKDLGIDTLQGFSIADPMPADKVLGWISRRTAAGNNADA